MTKIPIEEEKPWYHDGLKKLIDADILAAGSEAQLVDRDMVTLQLCREIKNLTQALHDRT